MTSGLGIVAAIFFGVLLISLRPRKPRKCDACGKSFSGRPFKLKVLETTEIHCSDCNDRRLEQIRRTADREHERAAERDSLTATNGRSSEHTTSKAPPLSEENFALPDLPPLALLGSPTNEQKGISEDELVDLCLRVERTLSSFHISAKVIRVYPGPVIITFELDLPPGVRSVTVANLENDIARALATHAVRVIEQIPGTSFIGLEIPNPKRMTVYLAELLRSSAYDDVKSPLTLAIGKDANGRIVVDDLAEMRHLLIAGKNGLGKSAAIDSIILSLIYKSKIDEFRLLLIDPSILHLSAYSGIPHLLAPVVSEAHEALNALRWCVAETERRHNLFTHLGARNIGEFNRLVSMAWNKESPLADPLFRPSKHNPDAQADWLVRLPYIVIVIDELAALMDPEKKASELIARLGHKSPIAGLHMVLTTGQPEDMIDGTIKANIPSRLAFQTADEDESRTILDQSGAERLLGTGDMLYLPSTEATVKRVHGAYIDDSHVHDVADWLRRYEI